MLCHIKLKWISLREIFCIHAVNKTISFFFGSQLHYTNIKETALMLLVTEQRPASVRLNMAQKGAVPFPHWVHIQSFITIIQQLNLCLITIFEV
jgi:hypothetical protein